MVALGVSVGTAVRIGQAAGAGDRDEARFAGLAGVAASMGLVALLGLAMLAAAPAGVGVYSADAGWSSGPRRSWRSLRSRWASTPVGRARPVDPGAGRQLGHDALLLPRLLLRDAAVPLVLAFHTPLAESGLFIGTALGCLTAVGLLGRRFLKLVGRV